MIASSQPDFIVSGSTCGVVLIAGATCQFNVQFAPTPPPGLVNGVVTVNGAVTISSSSVGSPQTVQLSGNAHYNYSTLVDP
jgi:hypothetical protein